MKKHKGHEGLITPEEVLCQFPSLCSFLGPKIPRAILAERAQAALIARKSMAEAQAQLRLKRTLKQQSIKVNNRIYSLGDKVLVRREKIINNRIGE